MLLSGNPRGQVAAQVRVVGDLPENVEKDERYVPIYRREAPAVHAL